MDSLDKLIEEINNFQVPTKKKKNSLGALTEAQKAAQRKKYAEERDKRVENSICECAAYFYPTHQFITDPKRFQNRVDAFSEASAEKVAKEYDPNKFDPIVFWTDPVTKESIVISGHSRLEGMRRRKEPRIPAREFFGSEAEAIKYSKAHANRSGTAESLVEDITAYRLLRDGDLSKNIAPSSTEELKNAFGANRNKLDAFTYLDKNGRFITALQNNTNDQYNHLNKFATWAGQLRKQYPDMTNLHEDDMFVFLYSDHKHQKIKKADFFELVKKRFALGAQRLFPECIFGEGCGTIKESRFLPNPLNEITMKIEDTQEEIDRLNERRGSGKTIEKINTKEEGEFLLEYEARLKKRKLELQKQLQEAQEGKAEKTALFGFRDYEIQ